MIDSSPDVNLIEQVLDQFIVKVTRLRSVDDEILNFMLVTSFSEIDYTKEFDVCEEYNAKLISTKQKMKQCFVKTSEETLT